MSVIRVTKEFHFEMAHALHGYNGPCKHIHGHSYCLRVCVIGPVNTDVADSCNGMVIDFSMLKAIVKTNVIDKWDHALLLNARSSELVDGQNEAFEKTIIVDYQPTCENMLLDIVAKIQPHLPEGVKLHHLHLRETPTSYAEWFAGDN